METTNNFEEQDISTPTEQQAMKEISAVRAIKQVSKRDRLAEFDKNGVDRPLSEIPMNTQINVMHADGIISLPITNAQEFMDAFMATISDWHGDFGLYEPLQESDLTAQDKLTDEQLQSIMEVEERAGIEFDEYNEAVEWERNEYSNDEISRDDPFDIER